MKDITGMLKELRISKSLTQKELAQKLEITQQTYSTYENGKIELPTHHLVKLAEIYNVTSDFILGIESDRRYSSELEMPFVDHVTVGEFILASKKLSEKKRRLLLYLARQFENLEEEKL